MKRHLKYMGASPRPAIEDYPRRIWDVLFGARHGAFESERHLEAVMGWLSRAQDAGDDDGVARMYHLKNGWGSSYPETTGYLIPTFFSFAQYSGRQEFWERAVRMARWESAVQMDSGAVQGGVMGDPPTPAIFNTGQVLFGWCAAYERTGDEKFRQSAVKAADYLVDQMDGDGAWRKNLSDFTSTALDTYAYNVRSAWAMILAQSLEPGSRYKSAALRNVEFVLSLCKDNGWIAKNCLGRPDQPLLHTIAYAYQGLLECAVLEGLDGPMAVVLRANHELLANFEQFGRLHGRYEEGWNPTVRWRCLTGEAQTAIVWQRLGDVTGEPQWKKAARAVLAQIKRTQALAGDPGKAGGIKGAYPITAPYGPLQYLNWAGKFFADALMMELGVDGAGRSG